MIEQLNIQVSEDRIKDMDLETFYHIDSNSPTAMIDFVAHFVVGENGSYLEKDAAVLQVLTGRKVKDIEQIMEDLKEAMDLMAVPKE